MKKYTYNTVYRGQQITKMCCAKSRREAAIKLGISSYQANHYLLFQDTDTTFEGIMAYFDSGMLYRHMPELIKVEMEYDKLKAIIDEYKNKFYAEFFNQINK